MKKLGFLFFAMLYVSVSFAITVPKGGDPSAKDVLVPLPASNEKISLSDFLTLTPRSYKARTGKRLGLKHTLEMRYAQRQLKTVVQADGTVNSARLKGMYGDGFQFHWGGFLLGFFFSLIGVLVTLFFNDDNRSNRIRSATYGALLMITILLVAFRLAMAGA